MITSTIETADTVFASSVIAHVGESGTLVDVLAVDVSVSFGTQFLKRGRARFRTRIASVTPGFADAVTANALEVMTLQLFGANAVTIVKVTRLLTLIDASSGRLVECQSRWAGAGERTFRVDADASTFANARVQVALVDVRASLAVHFGVTDGTVTFDRVAHFAWTSPRQTHRTAALGFQCESR